MKMSRVAGGGMIIIIKQLLFLSTRALLGTAQYFTRTIYHMLRDV